MDLCIEIHSLFILLVTSCIENRMSMFDFPQGIANPCIRFLFFFFQMLHKLCKDRIIGLTFWSLSGDYFISVSYISMLHFTSSKSDVVLQTYLWTAHFRLEVSKRAERHFTSVFTVTCHECVLLDWTRFRRSIVTFVPWLCKAMTLHISSV